MEESREVLVLFITASCGWTETFNAFCDTPSGRDFRYEDVLPTPWSEIEDLIVVGGKDPGRNNRYLFDRDTKRFYDRIVVEVEMLRDPRVSELLAAAKAASIYITTV